MNEFTDMFKDLTVTQLKQGITQLEDSKRRGFQVRQGYIEAMRAELEVRGK